MFIPGYTVITTKNADGTVNFAVYTDPSANPGSVGTPALKVMFNMASADVTSMNTNVNGGATGATQTNKYAGSNALSGNPQYTDPM